MQGVGSIVTDGLVLHLDAANYKSYPGSGTTWTDLTINNNSGSLINGPTFSFPNGGSIVFNGTNNYVDCGTNSLLNLNQNYSILFWIQTNSSASGAIIQRYLNSGAFPGYAVNINRLTSIGKIDFYTGGTWYTALGSNINNGLWHFIAITVNSTTCNFYLDNYTTQISVAASTSNPTDTLFIGSTEGNSVFYSGNISQVQIYNRALSATEVLQNYNGLKSRFGL